jgi:hypothetical protein
MKRTVMWVGVVALAAASLGWPATAHAQSVSIGVQTNNVQLGINLGPTPPPLVLVPGPMVAVPGPPPPPVYYAPGLPYNYFMYGNVYYLYHDARWFRARHYDGPWRAIAIDQVPRSVLAVPVNHYRNRPARWAHQGPPPWAHERAREHQWDQDHGHGPARAARPHGRGHGEGHG